MSYISLGTIYILVPQLNLNNNIKSCVTLVDAIFNTIQIILHVICLFHEIILVCM